MAFITVSEEDIFSMNQELRDIGWTGLDSEDSESWATGSFEKEKYFSSAETINISKFE